MSKKITYFIFIYCHAALSCLYLFSFGFLFTKNRLFLDHISSHFGYSKAEIPVISFSDLVSDQETKDISIEILVPVGIDGNVSAFELTVINTFIKLRKPSKILELGTFDGRTTLNMASNSSTNTKIWTLDLPKTEMEKTPLPLAPLDRQFISKDRSGTLFLDTEAEKKITQLYGDTATFNFKQLNNSIDMVFVDASHSYEYLLNDSEMALKLLRNKKGIILWHDYHVWEGVTRALNELYLNNLAFKNIQHIEGSSLACLIIE